MTPFPHILRFAQTEICYTSTLYIDRNKHLSHRPNQGTEKVIFFPSLSPSGYMESVEMV